MSMSPPTPSDALSRLSILIVTYHGDDWLRACLDSVQRACRGMPETVVVDNGASETTRELVAAFPHARYVRAETNLGFAGGNNLGLPFCGGEYILLLNNDTVIHDEPFTALIRYCDEHPQVGVAQGKMRLGNSDGLLDGCGTFLTATGIQYAYGFLVPDAPAFQKPYPVFAASGACFLIRRSVIAHAGGYLFYDHFRSYYEEVDFCHRVWLSGSEVHFVPTPVIDHLHSQTAGRFRRTDILRQYYQNLWFSLLTCLGGYGRLRILPVFAAFYAGNALAHLLAGHRELFRAHLDAVRRLWAMRDQIRSARETIGGFRARSDRALFRIILKSPPLRYYWRSIKSNAFSS